MVKEKESAMEPQSIQERAFGVVKSVGKKYKRGLQWCLMQVELFGIDVELQIDSLRDDFVTSNSFVKYVEKVFEESDVDDSGTLDGGEFYAAVLLLYHQLNRIPFGRKKFPPNRATIMLLFDDCYEKQQKLLGPRKQKKMLLAELVKSDKRLSSRRLKRPTLLQRVAPRVLRESAFSLCFFAVYMFVYNYFFVQDQILVPKHTQILAAFISLGIGLVLFNGTEIVIDELPAKIVVPENTRSRSESKEVREMRVVDKVSFLIMCQDHFTDVVASETWRIVTYALFLPIMAYQLKKALFSIKAFNDVFHSQKLLSEDAVIPSFVSVVLVLFPFIDSYVENSLWQDISTGGQKTYYKKHQEEDLDPERYEIAVKSSGDHLKAEQERRKKKRHERRESVKKQTREYYSDLEGESAEFKPKIARPKAKTLRAVKKEV